MEIGEYVIVIESEGGVVEAELARFTRSGRPIVGEEIEVGGELYRIERVVHEELGLGPTLRKYTVPRLHVRRNGGPRRGPRPREGGYTMGALFSASEPGKRYSVGPRYADIRHLPPPVANLVAVIVACGYREQRRRLELARELRQPASGGPLPRDAELDKLLRAAQSGYLHALAQLETLTEQSLRQRDAIETLELIATVPTVSAGLVLVREVPQPHERGERAA